MLTEINFKIMAAKHYDNILFDDVEFEEDLFIFSRLARIFRKYEKNGLIDVRLVLNNIIVVYNMWPNIATEMLFLKLLPFKVTLKTFLFYLEKKPLDEFTVGVTNKKISYYLIPLDLALLNRIQENE